MTTVRDILRAKPNSIVKARRDSELAVLKTWGNLCKKYVAIGKVCITTDYR